MTRLEFFNLISKRNSAFLMCFVLISITLGCNQMNEGDGDIKLSEQLDTNSVDTLLEKEEIVLSYACVLSSAPLPILNSDTVYEKDILPETENLSGRILFQNQLHNDEIKEDELAMSWVGLFKAKDYFLSKARVLIQNTFDPVLDVDSTEISGWLVKVKEGDVKCEFMFAQIPVLKESSSVKSIELPKNSVLPGDTFKIQFGLYYYKIYASGYCIQPNPGEDWYKIRNFRLFVEEEFEGKSKKQLIMTQPWFNENVVELMFAGDLDGDDRLDLIIDKTFHYNAYMPTLYLSGAAKKGKVLKCMASRTVVGC